MKRRSPWICLSAALLALAPLGASALARQIALNDFRALQRIASPRFSPDGKQIAFLSIRSDFVHDRYDATLRVIAVAGGEPRALVEGMRGLAMPRWSPDGHTLAFLAKVGARKAQIYTVPAAGGTPTQLSDARNGVQQYAWSPDGSHIAFVTPDDSPLSSKERRTHQDLFTIHDDDYLIDKPPVPSHIWLLAVKTGKARQITRGPTSVLETAPPFGGGVSAPSWSADGQWIAYARQADANDADSDRTTIVAVNVASGEEHPISGPRTYEYVPRFGPKADRVAYLYLHGPGAVSDVDLFVASPRGGAARDLSADLDRNLLPDFAWLSDGSAVVVMADDHVRTRLYIQPLHGAGHALDLGALNPLTVAASSDGALAVVADNATRAPELYLLRTPSSTAY
jgi:Tol biopolymer transport system component